MLYFRGCTARERETSIADATEKLLKLAGVSYHILEDEKCCGSVLLRTGFEKEAEEQMKKNMADFKDETILTSCAGCYKTLSQDYDGLEVIHISQLLKKLIDEGKLKLNRSDLKVTYHDSCHLARHYGVFNEPRDVIKAVATLCEMEHIKKEGTCCGAGGGVKSAYPEIANQLADFKIKEAKETGADVLITACPFCKLNLEDKGIEVLDLTEFLSKYGGIQ